MTMTLLLSLTTMLMLPLLVLLTLPAGTAGVSNGIPSEETEDLPVGMNKRKSERRLLKGRVGDTHHHHHHGDGKDSGKDTSPHAHHDIIHQPSKHRHHHESFNEDNNVYLNEDNHDYPGLIMTVVNDGCGPIGRKQHCPPIEICLIKDIVASFSRRVLSAGVSEELEYIDVRSHTDGREGMKGTGILGTGMVDTESLDGNDEMDRREVGWDGNTAPSISDVFGVSGGIPTRRPSAKPSTHVPTRTTPIKQLASLPSFLPSPIPTSRPTRKPVTRRPSRKPSHTPSSQPTSRPSTRPTSQPTPEPTYEPTPEPEPSLAPTSSPTIHPTRKPITQRPITPPASTPTTPTPPLINTGNNLINHGGKVMTTTQTVAIFWGQKWAIPSFVNDKITGIDSFYQGFGNSNYAAIVSQYSGSNGQATAYSTYLGHYIDTSSTGGIATPPTHSDIFKEVCKIIAANSNTLKPDGSTYFFAVYTDIPRGQAGYCAWHSSGACSGGSRGTLIQFVFFFDLEGDAACDPGDKYTGNSQGLAAIVNVSGHELCEAITDPPSFTTSAWYDSNGQEIADKCGWQWGLPYVTLSNGKRYKIQMEWSNTAGGCVQGGP